MRSPQREYRSGGTAIQDRRKEITIRDDAPESLCFNALSKNFSIPLFFLMGHLTRAIRTVTEYQIQDFEVFPINLETGCTVGAKPSVEV
jgi:hypothetical protein